VHFDTLEYERDVLQAHSVVVGIDEVGRGALAGPLVVGAVAVSELDLPPIGLTDSKMLRPGQREALVEPIQVWATASSLGWVSAQEIDSWGLRVALAVAATRALEGLACSVPYVLIDGTFNMLDAPLGFALGGKAPPALNFAATPHECIIKGDQLSATIAAASVLAKVARDAYMHNLDAAFPAYGWTGNKGYGSPSHLDALRRFGPTAHHRTSWRLPEREAVSHEMGE
jgi:ribonuclease HII